MTTTPEIKPIWQLAPPDNTHPQSYWVLVQPENIPNTKLNELVLHITDLNPPIEHLSEPFEEPFEEPVEPAPVEPAIKKEQPRKKQLRFVKITTIKPLPAHPLQNSIKHPKMSKMSKMSIIN